mgnify:CR=1 FL=1|jgi:Importin beta-related nuclear transport receptor
MASTIPLNGVAGAAASGNGGGDAILKIHEALKIVYSPQSTNQARQEAQAFLESVKSLPEAPEHGFNLAFNQQDPIVRHYGLSLLEHAVKHRWADYTPELQECLRNYMLRLTKAITDRDPLYLRNKIAQLWVEIAKRAWCASWLDMDAMLVHLWQLPGFVHKLFVLKVLESLSEDIFNSDDVVVALREGALSKACVEIFTPAAILSEEFPNRQKNPEVRFQAEGWLPRITQFIGECLSAGVQSEDVAACAAKALNVLTSVIPWVIPKAISAVNGRGVMCSCLATSSVPVQKAALEALYALYSRSNYTEEEFVDLVVPMYGPEAVDLCRRLYEWSTVDAHDIDEDKYQFAKKFSEMLCCLGNYLDRKFTAIPVGTNVQGFLELLMLVVQSQSLVVSIPILLTWTRILSHRALGPAAVEMPFIGNLLELCSNRLLRYEWLPEDTEDPIYVLLNEDTDTVPERHAFLGNYRRYCCSVIESIVNLQLQGAFTVILNRAEHALNTLYDGQPPLSRECPDLALRDDESDGHVAANYQKNSMPVLTVDCHATVIEAALKGYDKWKLSRNRTDEDVRSTLSSPKESR